ncbi:MAG: hypothetical protein M0R46_08500 [Candidatus Muirbacterium halophilum]|nr:hypothetical protein [Candidatus Muirbacterium halophilum]MCK9475944.1 hypothetical protein [Candidatus Muirbacterium halophilum]
MKKFLCGFLLFTGICVFSESVITFPQKDQVQGTKKNLILKITIPNEMENEEDYKEKTTDFSYFDLEPFKKINSSIVNYDILRSFPKKKLVTRTRSSYLCSQKGIKNEYDLFLVLTDIVDSIERKGKDELLENGVTREDINYIEKLIFKDYPNYLKKTVKDGEKIKTRLAFLKRQFLAGKGEVRVLKVETNDAGETMIHIRLNEED